MPASPTRGIAPQRWLAAWDSQGNHRTATDGDNAGAEWLAAEAAALGADVGDRVRRRAARPRHGLSRHRWRAHSGDPGLRRPPTGRRRRGQARAGRRAMPGSPSPSCRRKPSIAANTSGCGATRPSRLCDPVRRAESGPVLLNAEKFREPFGMPTIHVSSAARDIVLAAAAERRPARLVSESRRTAASARNIVVSFDAAGRDRAAAPVIVMTPRSSWWQSTAERGGGIVCWLETLRALLASRPVPSSRLHREYRP